MTDRPTFQFLDLRTSGQNAEVVDELKDGGFVIGLGPKIFLKTDEVGLAKLIGRLTAIQCERETELLNKVWDNSKGDFGR